MSSGLYQPGYLSWVTVDYYDLGLKISPVERSCHEMGISLLLKPGHISINFGSDTLIPERDIKTAIKKFSFGR
jgi:hypothetical protein